MEEQDANTVNIAARRGRRARQGLGREIHRGSGDVRRDRALRAAGAEVHQHQAAAVFAHDVLRLDVAVHEPRRMNGRERAAHVGAERAHFARAHRSVRPQPRLQRLPVDQFHPQADPPVPYLGAVNRDDVLVADLRERPRFGEELIERVPGRGPAPQNLQRHVAIELRIVRGVDLAVGAAGDSLADA